MVGLILGDRKLLELTLIDLIFVLQQDHSALTMLVNLLF